ncbi:MAG TPA: 3-deoxy-D-manno-octulosonic acid transferase, partial [Microscillaceae bacterium]|nr:3-deoxy-D-manno-octulosonic acid transferase [Microscillaceae bacterium]
RVIAIVQNKKSLAFAEAFKQESPTLVLGSSWWKDIQILAEALPLLPEDLKVILVPHEISPTQIASAIQLLNTAVIQYSQIHDNTRLSDYKVLIVDTVGMLTTLYQYADVAYVGGGFEDGQPHNVLEPAVYGVPVLFGNKYQKAKEAVDLVATGGGIAFDNAADLVQKILPLLQTETLRKQKGVIAQQFVFDHAGATQKIMTFVRSVLK